MRNLSKNPVGLAGLAWVLLAGLAACSSTKSREPQPALIAGSGSFDDAMRGALRVSLHPRARIVRPRPGQSHAQLQQEMEGVVIDALEERGFAVVRPGFGEDRVIAYAIGIEGELSDQEMVELFGISAGIDNDPEHLRGGVVLAVALPRSNKVLWRGSASGNGDGSEEGTSERLSQIRAAMEAIMAGGRPTPQVK